MRIMGTKFCGHDSAICILDIKKKKIFAISTERVTRIKHDSIDITPIIEAYDFENIDYVSHSYSDFEDKGHDGELREKMTFNKEIEKALRSIIKPKFAADLSLSRFDKNLMILKSLFTNFSSVQRYYGAKFKRALVKETPEGNKNAFNNYIKTNLAKFKLTPKKVFFYDHHLCHATPSYYLSPFNGQKALALTIDGQGDGYFSKLFYFNGIDNYKLVGQSTADFMGEGDRFLSIGRLYNYFTQAMDLRPNSDEGKVEALAAFGNADEDLYQHLMRATHLDKNLLSINFDIQLIKPFYDINWLKKQRNRAGNENFCATIQTYLEDIMVNYLNIAYEKYPTNNLCLSGGVAANIIMSLAIYEKLALRTFMYILLWQTMV